MHTDKQIIEYVESVSYFKLNDYGKDLSFTTRDNGDMYTGEYGVLDYEEAKRLRKEILNDFEDIICEIDTFDEWVGIFIKEKK